jgi:hypothetical protein
MKDIIEEILALVKQFYSCVGRERKKNKTGILRVRNKRKKKLLLKKKWFFERRLFHLS